MKYRKAYEWGRARLEMAGIDEASLDARLLLEHVCHTTRNDLYANSERELTASEEESYEEMVRRRASHIPLQHLTGEQEFMGIPIRVSEAVLIPRQDTEILAEEALIVVNDGDRVLDLCTGSGCVLLSVMRYKNDICGVGTDLSPEALAVARGNYEANRSVIGGKAVFLQGDLFDALKGDDTADRETEGLFDVITANPPYIASGVIPTLSEEVRLHDPMMALDGGADGLDFYRRITGEVAGYLRPEGTLLVEIGYDQGQAVSDLFRENGFTDVKVIRDLAGLDRVVRGRRTEI